MTNQPPFGKPARRPWKRLMLLAGLVAGAAACQTQLGEPGSSGGPGQGPVTMLPGSGGAGAGGAGSGAGGGPTNCAGSEVAAPKRLVRLTFNQIVASIGSLLGNDVASSIAQTFEIGDATQRTFPPLASPREGSVVTDSQWQTGDNIAQTVAEHVLGNFEVVTGCGAAPTDECGQQFVADFGQRAFRRPLTERERTRLLQVFTDVRALGSTVQQAVQHGVYAALESPHFLYRTEFGSSATTEGVLTPDEIAGELSFFLTDAPPDAELLAAAANGSLSTPEGLAAEVDRLLASEATKLNLELAAFAYFQLPGLDTVVIDPLEAPDFNAGVRNAMYHESELFLQNTLWNEPLTDLLTSRRTTINADLAALYGVAFPPVGVTPGADGFAPVELPETRAGLLTQAGFLAARSRPDTPSVVGRGLAVNAAFLCAQNPPFPEDLTEQVDQASAALAGETERAQAEYRMNTPACGSCHLGFDPYGLVLSSFDIIGKYGTMDAEGRPIDTSVTLPETAGGGVAAGAPEMAQAIANSGAFSICMAKNFLAYALAEGGASTASCATRAIVDRFNQSDGTFTALVREVALSTAFSVRTAGVAQ